MEVTAPNTIPMEIEVANSFCHGIVDKANNAPASNTNVTLNAIRFLLEELPANLAQAAITIINARTAAPPLANVVSFIDA